MRFKNSLALFIALSPLFALSLGAAQSPPAKEKTVVASPCRADEKPETITSRLPNGETKQSIKCVKIQPAAAATTIKASPATPPKAEPSPRLSTLTWPQVIDLLLNFLAKHWWLQLLLILVAAAAFILVRIYQARRAECLPTAPNQNGIGIEAPKLYDTRSLSLMLEEMQDQLRRLNNISQQPITDAAANIQDQRNTDTDAVLSGNAPRQADPKSQGTNSGSGDKTNPPLSSAPAATTPSKALGERPVDLLSDQVNLTYEVLNLRLILERALSDRLFDGKPRLQAVLGFPVSIDTPAFAAGCCANIDVTLSVQGQEQPSLVALLPQERTFNSTVGARQSRSGSIGVPFKWFNLGVQGRASSDENSFDREPETIGILGRSGELPHDPHATTSETKFGWQIRPIAGRRSVTAGMRQLFAVVSLPQRDLAREDKLSLTIKVRTTWRRFNRRTATSSDRLNPGAWFSRRPVTDIHTWRQPLLVDSTLTVEESLHPYIDKIVWQAVAADRAVITVTGRNFFPGTAIILGDKNYRTVEDGIVIKSEKTVQLTAPLSALLFDAILDGRYGPSLRLETQPDHTQYPSIKLEWSSLFTPAGGSVAQLKMGFRSLDGAKSIDWNKFLRLPDPLLQINGQVVNTPLYFYPTEAMESGKLSQFECWTLIPSESVKEDNCTLKLKFPFMGSPWEFNYRLFLPRPRIQVQRAKAGTGKVGLMLVGQDGTFYTKPGEGAWTVLLDKTYQISADGELQLVRPNLLLLTVSENLLDSYDTVTILPPPEGSAIVCSVPTAAISSTGHC